jgi:hypothetical protein
VSPAFQIVVAPLEVAALAILFLTDAAGLVPDLLRADFGDESDWQGIEEEEAGHA